MSRGQTTIDFGIGVGVFIIAVAFVITFVPGMLQPFSAGSQEEIATVDRVADTLSQDLLTGDRENVLEPSCAVAFFNASASDAGCAFDNSNDVRERLGLGDRQRVNVQLVGADVDGDGTNDVLCADASGRIDEDGTGGFTCKHPFVAGDDVAQTGSVITARRWGSVAGHDASVLVRMW